MNKLWNENSLVYTFLFEQSLHIFGVAQTELLPYIIDYFVDISVYSIVREDASSQVAKHGVCIIYIYIRRDIEFEFIMIDCQNIVCIRTVRLGVFVIIVYRPPSNSSEHNNHLFQFIRWLIIFKRKTVTANLYSFQY